MLQQALFQTRPMLCFEITDRCNMACPMCITKSHRRSCARPLALDEIKSELLEPFRFAGGRQVVITGGEPTLSDDLPAVLEYAARLGLKLFLATNLYQVDDLLLRRILEPLAARKHSVMVSYDSIFAQEMEMIRGVDAIREVTSNLVSLLALRKQLKAETKLCASLVLQKENSVSAPDTIKFLLRLGLDKIFVQPINSQRVIDMKNRHRIKPLCAEGDLPEIFAAVDNIFLLAEAEPRIRITGRDKALWRRHFTDPRGQKGGCRSNGFIFVDSFGNYRGCNNSAVCANIRDVGVVGLQCSRFYQRHKELISSCSVCLNCFSV